MTRRFGAALFLLLFSTPEIAAAHTPIKGIGAVFNGMLHPVVTPSHLLLLIATCLLLGRGGIDEAKMPLLVSIAMVVTGLALSGFSPGVQVEQFILVWAAVTGLLVAASPKISAFWYALIGAVAGFSLGFDSGQDMSSVKDNVLALFGSGIGIYFLSLYPLRFAEFSNSKNWLGTGIRVIGSWIAASALLVLALEISSQGDI